MQIKYTAIAAVVLALGAGAAQAKIAQPATGNGELFLSLYDTRGTDAFSDDKTLVVDLGAILGTGGNAVGRVNNWLSDNTTAADPVFDMAKSTHGYSITALDPKVVAFLQNGSFDNMLWSVVAGDSAGRDRVLTTVNGSASAQNAAAFRNASTVIAQFSTNTNQGPEGDNIAESTNASSLFVGDGAANFSSFGTKFSTWSSFSNAAKPGESMAFNAYWENAAVGAVGPKSSQFGADFPYAGWKLHTDAKDFGALVYSVPEPETYAMMGVGLLAIAAIARRRRAARA